MDGPKPTATTTWPQASHLTLLRPNFFYFIYLFTWPCQVLVATCSMACGISVPQPEIEPASPALRGRFLTTGAPAKSLRPNFLSNEMEIYYLSQILSRYNKTLQVYAVWIWSTQNLEDQYFWSSWFQNTNLLPGLTPVFYMISHSVPQCSPTPIVWNEPPILQMRK